MILDREQDPRSRDAAPYEHRFYGLLKAELRPSRPALSIVLAGLTLVSVAGFAPGPWTRCWGYVLAVAAVLAAQDLGRSLVTRTHGIVLGWPLWLPFPFLGTLGSLLRTRGPNKSNRDLFDLALAGPVFGLLMSCLFLVVGFASGSLVPARSSLPFGVADSWSTRLWFGEPGVSAWTDSWLAGWLAAAPPAGQDWQASPWLFAGRLGVWLGFVNLLPAGWLDGAFLSRALVGRRGQRLARATAAALVLAAVVKQDAWWLLMAAVCLVPGRKISPPLNPFQKLNRPRWLLAGLALLLALLTASSPRALFSGW